MPTMPRPYDKASKIAFKIMGEPDNLAYKPSEKEKRIEQVIRAEDTFRKA